MASLPFWKHLLWKGGRGSPGTGVPCRRRGAGTGRWKVLQEQSPPSTEGEAWSRFWEKGSRKMVSSFHSWHSPHGLLTSHQPSSVPREPARVPTRLFLKLTRNGLVGLSALYLQSRGLLGLVPTSRRLWSGAAGPVPSPALSYSGLPLSPRAGAGGGGPWSHQSWPNGNTPIARLHPGPQDALMKDQVPSALQGPGHKGGWGDV